MIRFKEFCKRDLIRGEMTASPDGVSMRPQIPSKRRPCVVGTPIRPVEDKPGLPARSEGLTSSTDPSLVGTGSAS